MSAAAERLCLVILDGWGLAPPGPGNAVALARTPIFDELWANCPHTTLTTWGRAVGLPEGQMGNSEVGHLNLGAGTVVRQDLTRIDEAVESGTLGENDVIREALTAAPRVHLVGLASAGGVHSSLEHLRALIELAAELGTQELILHCFTDGRDTLPRAGLGYIEAIEAWCAASGEGRPGDAASGEGQAGDGSPEQGPRARARVGSVVGRYFAMDRDRRWERIQQAYDLLVHGRAPHHAASAREAMLAAYERGETDEFIAPTTVGPEARIQAGDSVLCFNFRPDRMREISRALAEIGFGEGPPEDRPGGWEGRDGAEPVERFVTLTSYQETWPYPVAFPPERPRVTLAGVIAAAGLNQLHVAETEKYPHVTYFFNGGREIAHEGERRELIPSPRDIPTYDHRPQMSARETARSFVEAWQTDMPAFAIINFANPDMVGHTGVIEAAVKAVETVDDCLGEVLEAVHAAGGLCLITADHGNAEHMLEPDGGPNTAHTLNPVPLILTGLQVPLRPEGGILADVAPTVLELLGISQPADMKGSSLIEHPDPSAR